VEYQHGGSKAVFYLSAEGRIDFRDLVKDLAQKLRTRIEMRQIGVRDEAKMVGGIGVCGLRVCCNRYLTKFEPVSIRMAKDQNLVLNPQKVSGQCGRLKCCLAYEEEVYRQQKQGMPKTGKLVETPAGPGKVVELDILARRVRVALMAGGFEVFPVEAIRLPEPPGSGGSGAPAAGPSGRAALAEPPEPDEPDEPDEPVASDAPVVSSDPEGSAPPDASGQPEPLDGAAPPPPARD
jgi:hypothetical protein